MMTWCHTISTSHSSLSVAPTVSPCTLRLWGGIALLFSRLTSISSASTSNHVCCSSFGRHRRRHKTTVTSTSTTAPASCTSRASCLSRSCRPSTSRKTTSVSAWIRLWPPQLVSTDVNNCQQHWTDLSIWWTGRVGRELPASCDGCAALVDSQSPASTR